FEQCHAAPVAREQPGAQDSGDSSADDRDVDFLVEGKRRERKIARIGLPDRDWLHCAILRNLGVSCRTDELSLRKFPLRPTNNARAISGPERAEEQECAKEDQE